MTRARVSADATRRDVARWHPASLDSAPPTRDQTLRRPRAPQLVTAGLILVTAATVLEGYRWLQVIPSGRLHPPALVFAALVVPTTVFLTRPIRPWTRTPTQWVALTVVAGLVVVTLVEVVTGRAWSADLLGAYDLVTGAAILAAALIGAEAFVR